jgi:hypothetical protein
MIQIQHLETDITLACQLSCTSCNHSVPLYRAQPGGPPSTTPQIVEHDLARLAPILHAKVWGALGGEPTLNKHLVDILHVVRASGICDRIEVWTNTLTIRRQSPEFWRSFDVLVGSLYPGKVTDEDVRWIEAKCKDEGVEWSPRDERRVPNFQNMLDPYAPSSPERTQTKFDRCFFKNFSRVVNFGYFYTCCCAPHLPHLLQGRPKGSDGISLDGVTEDALRAYLTRTEPLGACVTCAGRDWPAAKRIPWSEEKEPMAWIARSKGLPA